MNELIERIGQSWRYPQWEKVEGSQWNLIQGFRLVGEAYETENGFKWHCKTSDWRDTNAISIEQAKAECEASFWKEEWDRLRDAVLSHLKTTA